MTFDFLQSIFHYWNQALVVVALIGYFGKRYFDLRNKRLELSISLFQQQKLTSVQHFIAEYCKIETFFREVPYHDVANNKITASQLDDIASAPYNKFIEAFFTVSLFCTDSELNDFEYIYRSVDETRNKLGALLYIPDDEKKMPYLNAYSLASSKMQDISRIQMTQISLKFRKSYGFQ